MPAAEIEPEQSLIDGDDRKEGFECNRQVCGLFSCIFFFVLAAFLNYGIYPVLSNMAVTQFLTIPNGRVTSRTGDGYDISNLSYKTGWPLCPVWEEGQTLEDRFDGRCGEECFSRDLPMAMQAAFESSGGHLVTYLSRQADGVETVQLSGWWIPAEGNISEAPRIVHQHGFTGNSNTLGPVLMAYHLRRLGYSVLLNNFRDHGYSNRSQKRIQEWGDAYPYDLLGAWDYLVNDPDGLLGGSMPESKVGIVGNSKGGFTTLNAMGLESRVPAAWVDSPPFTPKAVFAEGVNRIAKGMGVSSLLRLVTPYLHNRLYEDVLVYARDRGADIEKNLPEKNMPMGPDTSRPVFVTTNPLDGIVPVSEYQNVLALMAEYPEKYAVESMYTHETCRGAAHTLGLLMEEDLYTSKLCTFWRNAFGEDASTC